MLPALAFDSQGNLYVADDNNITRFTPSGASSVFASQVIGPWGLAFDSQCNLYVSNTGDTYGNGGNVIERITPSGVVSVFATAGLDVPKGLAFDSQGDLFVANYGNGTIEEIAVNGTVSILATLDLTTQGCPSTWLSAHPPSLSRAASSSSPLVRSASWG